MTETTKHLSSEKRPHLTSLADCTDDNNVSLQDINITDAFLEKVEQALKGKSPQAYIKK